MNSLVIFNSKRCSEFSLPWHKELDNIAILSEDEFEEETVLPAVSGESASVLFRSGRTGIAGKPVKITEMGQSVFAGGQELKGGILTKVGYSTYALLTPDSEKRVVYSIKREKVVRFGNFPGESIRFLDSCASFVLDSGMLTVFDNDALYVNGKRASGSYGVREGDCVWAGSTKITFIGDCIVCSGSNYESYLNIAPNPVRQGEDFPIYKRSPRVIHRAPTDQIELNPPPAKEERKKGGLVKVILPPLLMTSMTVAMGIAMGRGIFMLMSAGGALLSLVFSITTFLGDQKKFKGKETERVANYERNLLAWRKKLHDLYEAQKLSLEYHNLAPKEIEREISEYSSRIYERASNDNDFLTLSLGSSSAKSSYKVKYKEDGAHAEDELTAEMQKLGAEFQRIAGAPTVVDLKKAHVGLVGEKKQIHRELKSILMQLCFFQSYHDIEIIVLLDEEYRDEFKWARWYPHCKIKSINISGIVTADNHRDQVLGNISQILKARRQKQQEEKKDARYLPHYIFIIDNPKLIINHSVMEYLQDAGSSLGFSLIYTTNIRANLPENIKTVFMLEGGDIGSLQMNEGVLLNQRVKLPDIEGINFESAARRMAPLKHTQGISTQIPESVTFFEMFGVKRPEEIPIMNLWRKNACHKSLAVPLGLRGKGDIVDLNLHEKAHGPHGLVAGTTGSGKSEIIQSYILSLAANFHPHEVGFLLIDYKGGGMANLFKNLPHLLGTITNLDGSESMRALASIKAENARRMRIFGEVDVNNINKYTKLFKAGKVTEPMPHLFIISDEFAELKKEQPEFMSELVSVARIGRSLGVHLILATQKPAGVVDDQIWSNSKFKLALKVANESDSNEVLKTPDAARITQPGRAYLQVGNNEIYELFQSAWSGAPYIEDIVEKGFDSRVYALNQLGQGSLLNEDLSSVDKAQDSKKTQLDVVVDYVKKLYDTTNSAEVAKPWLPPLDQKIANPSIKLGGNVGLIRDYNLSVALGVMDLPERQAQEEYIHNFIEDGNLAVFGASGFGKSTVQLNAAIALASQNSPALLNYFILDFGNSTLIQLKGLPHTADYLTFDENEKLKKLIKLLNEEIRKRKNLFALENAVNFKMYNEIAAKKLPAVILWIDNYDVIREIGMELEEFLTKLTRDGAGIGIYTVITSTRPSAVRYSVLNNFKNKMALFMFDSSDITTTVGRCEYKLPEIRGRALVKTQEAHIMQSYLPVEYEDDLSYSRLIGRSVKMISDTNTAPKAVGVRMLPEILTYGQLLEFDQTTQKLAAVGMDTETIEPQYLDMSQPVNIIVGGPQTGKTNILKLIISQFNNEKLFISDSRAYDLQDYQDLPNATYMCSESGVPQFYTALLEEVSRREKAFQNLEGRIRPRDFCASQPPALVIIDDVDNFIELCKSKTREMEQLLPKAKEMGIAFVMTTLPSKFRGFDNLTKILKDPQCGLILGNPNDQSVLPFTPPRGYKPLPDTAIWYKRGDFRIVKIPFIRQAILSRV